MGCAGSRATSASGISLTRSPFGSETGGTTSFAGPHDELVNGVATACGPGECLSCGEDRAVALVNWGKASVVQRWRGHERGVNRVIAAPHVGSAGGAASASRDTTVRLWRRGEDDAVATMRGHELSVSAIALSADGGSLLSGSRDSSVRLWDVATATCTTKRHISRNVVTCLRWVEGEPHLVAQGSEDLRLRVWDVRSLGGQPAATLEGYVYFPLCVDSCGPYLLTGSNGFDGVGCEVRPLPSHRHPPPPIPPPADMWCAVPMSLYARPGAAAHTATLCAAAPVGSSQGCAVVRAHRPRPGGHRRRSLACPERRRRRRRRGAALCVGLQGRRGACVGAVGIGGGPS